MSKVKLMTQAEYAQHRGVSAVAVHKAVKAGRISLIEGKIDPKVADIQWAQNTRPRADRRHGRGPAADLDGEPTVEAGRAPVIVAQQVSPVMADDEGGDYWVARARRERAEASISEMRRAELAGQLIRTEAVRSAWAKRITIARDALLQIPPRLAPVLAAESDMERVAQLLEDELRNALAELSRGEELQGA